MQIFLIFLLFVVAGALGWKLLSDWLTKSPEVRRLEKMKRAMRAQLKAKRQLLELRRELGDVQAELDAHEESEMQRLEEQLESLSTPGRPPDARLPE